ncbi:hypothetical protein GCM10008938_44280 [Deinococcus roseus]|uniref:Uncharacterized protein n=1 Tax=Deinococcus roseus TaxID=392414 RepID=A0ABQ2DCJ8_9DEIO|nr:hypothetical protein GCM10008938_44280 [Deinococcus roseus]
MARKWRKAYAIIRIDEFLESDSREWSNMINVKSVFDSNSVKVEEVIAEVNRLNLLNSEKGVVYFWQSTKLYDELEGNI